MQNYWLRNFTRYRRTSSRISGHTGPGYGKALLVTGRSSWSRRCIPRVTANRPSLAKASATSVVIEK